MKWQSWALDGSRNQYSRYTGGVRCLGLPRVENGSWQRVTNAVATEVDGQLFLTDPTASPTRAFYRVEHE